LVSSDPLISSLKKTALKGYQTYLPTAVKLFAFPKESEDLISSEVTTIEGDSVDTNEEISNLYH